VLTLDALLAGGLLAVALYAQQRIGVHLAAALILFLKRTRHERPS
jgi:hypothetical protein